MTYCSKYAVRVDTLWSQNACADRPTSDGQLYTMSRWHCSHYKHSVAHATYKLLLKRNGSLIRFLPRVPRITWRRCVGVCVFFLFFSIIIISNWYAYNYEKSTTIYYNKNIFYYYIYFSVIEKLFFRLGPISVWSEICRSWKHSLVGVPGINILFLYKYRSY